MLFRFSPPMAAKIAAWIGGEQPELAGLTEQELEVLRLVARNWGNRQIVKALANMARHSGAGRVALDITCDDGGATLTVTDDGRGFRGPRRLSALAQRGHFGLLGMAERLALLGGRLEVRSQPGEGTTVQAWLPAEVQEERTL